jgi:hypothetical protein
MFLGFSSFTAAAENATPYYIRPYGIYYRGEVYWAAALPRKTGTVVKFFEDNSGPCLSLVVFDLDGNFIANAWPVSWAENDHPAQHALSAWWETLSEDEREEMNGRA